MKIEIYPLVKVTIDGASIYLGMERPAVEAIIGRGEQVGERYYYFDSDMEIDYDKNNKVEFIQFLGGIDGSLHPFIYGVPVYETPADELTALLREKNHGDVDDTEEGYSYAFLNISVGIYREARPIDVAEMIEEMKANGIDVENNEDLATDIRRANYWATIGIGIPDYYRAIREW